MCIRDRTSVVEVAGNTMRLNPEYESSVYYANGDPTWVTQAFETSVLDQIPEWVDVQLSTDPYHRERFNFALELHYSQAVDSGEVEVKLHGDHLSLINKTSNNYLYGVPYPLKVVYKNEYKQEGYPSDVGDDYLYWKTLHELGGPSDSYDYFEGEATDTLPDHVWVDRGEVNKDQVGHMIRVHFAFEPMLLNRLSVQNVPGTSLWGIPLVLEVGQKPNPHPNGTTSKAGADFVSFWIVLTDGSSKYDGPDTFDFLVESEPNSKLNFGPQGGHAAGNGYFGRVLGFQNASVKVNSTTNGIGFARAYLSIAV